MFAELDPKAACERLSTEKGAVYVDVRSVEEYDAGHPVGAWNLPIMHATPRGMAPNPDFASVAASVLPKDALLVVGCKSGPRSRMACQALEGLGFPRLANVDGGFHGKTDMLGRVTTPGWQACGLPSTSEPTPSRTWAELRAAAGLA